MLHTCTRCNSEKPLDDFHRGKNYKHGRRSTCKVCVSAEMRERHKATYVQKTEAEWKASRFATEQRKQARLQKKKELILERARIREEKRLAEKDSRLKKAKEKAAAYRAAYKKKYPERRKAEKLNRKLKIRTSGVLSNDIVKTLMVSQNCLCVYCKKDIRDNFHVDHIYPVARGGTNTDDNVQLLCPECNLAKSDKDPVVFLASFKHNSQHEQTNSTRKKRSE